jgi:formate dehydrogenase iron-sulfur subunit
MIQFDEVNNIARKCDLCIKRIENDRPPACVTACPSHCIYYGDVEDIVAILGKDKMPDWYKNAGQ